MKNLLTLIILMYSISSFATTVDTLNSTFVFRSNYVAAKCDPIGNIIKGQTLLIEQDYRVEVNYMTKDAYVLSILKFRSAPDINAKLYQDTNTKEYIYFIIEKSIFKQICVAIPDKNEFKVGVPTIPIKMRPASKGLNRPDNDFVFEGNISLGLSIAYTRNMGNYNQVSSSVIGGISITSVSIDSGTTNGAVNIKTNASAVTPMVGLIFGTKNFSAGAFYGVDYLSGKLNKNWVYRNQGWFGVGISYNIFTEGSPGLNK